MAAADLMVMIFNVIVYLIINYHFPYSFLSYTAVCKFLLYLAFVNLDMSVWFTVSFTFDRFMAICCQKFKEKYCTKRTATAAIVTLCFLACLKGVPILFSYEPERIILKVQWGCRTTAAVYALPAWSVYSWIQTLSVPLLPFALMVLFNSLTVRRILLANRARRGLRGVLNENQSDPEVKSRRKSIILLFTISGSFIFLWLTAVVSFAVTRLSSTVYYQGDYSNPEFIATETGYLLVYMSSCTNTCMYAATQVKFREELKNVLKSPWVLIHKIVTNKENLK